MIVAPISHSDENRFDKSDLVYARKLKSLLDIDGTTAGRFDIDISGVNFECYLSTSDTKRLFVFQGSAGRSHTETSFSRVSWQSTLNGFCLCIEDPMYKLYPSLGGGWYYGFKNRAFSDDVSSIVKYIASSRGISNDDIIFIGSSASGYAAIHAAHKVEGSICLAYNPQIRLRDWAYAKTFERITGQNLSNYDIFGRNCLRHVSNNKLSRFFICSNFASPQDFKQQIAPWLEQHDMPAARGIHRLGNVSIIAFDAPSQRPHHVFPGVEKTCELLSLLLYAPETSDVECLSLFSGVRRQILLDEKLRRAKLWSSILMRRDLDHFSDRLVLPRYSDMNHCIIKIKSTSAIVRYVFVLARDLKTVSVEFRVQDKALIDDKRVISELQNVSNKYHLKFVKGEFLKIIASKVSAEHAMAEMSRLVTLTLPNVLHMLKYFHADGGKLPATA